MRDSFCLWLKRAFVKWHRISAKEVPRIVRSKLYKSHYVVHKKREYRKNVYRYRKKYLIPDGLCHDTGVELFEKKYKRCKSIKYYYRKL